MAKYFESRKAIFYPKKYTTLMNTMLNQQKVEPVTSNFNDFFETNAHLLVFSACVGLTKGITEEFKNEDATDIRAETFENNNFLGRSLISYAALIAYLYKKDEKAEILREENDAEFIRIFETLAAGGLSYLNNEQFSSKNDDLTAGKLLNTIMLRSFKELN